MEENKLQQEIDAMSKSIKTDNYPMSIGELANLYLDGEININPIYQRMFRWDIIILSTRENTFFILIIL